ncbi:hypothetical protein K458DRAFT_427838 [Lentithecium fluviatile CBS 122367]|uniref:Cytochrome P450 n=1 Tax=Lentithecium fluviatile CBS 122367 TaxID=1168545 RepID=A0A6G1JGN2_9PLEO|nr:hypothetical protein K458DRAFT_427838 [Lentithecium fluviatile CBS 122367]
MDILRFPLEIAASVVGGAFSSLFLVLSVGAKMTSLMPLLIRWNFPLSEVPGPKYASWPLFLQRMMRNGDEQEHLDDMAWVSAEYGPVARIGPHTVVISAPELVQDLSDMASAKNAVDREHQEGALVLDSDVMARGYRLPAGTVVELVGNVA